VGGIKLFQLQREEKQWCNQQKFIHIITDKPWIKRGTPTESNKRVVKFISAISCLLNRHGLLTVVRKKQEH